MTELCCCSSSRSSPMDQLAAPPFKLQPQQQQRLPGALDRLRILLALSFEALAGILRAVIAFWDALFTSIAWRIVRYAEASAQYSSPGSTDSAESKTFPTNLANRAVHCSDQERAIAFQGRSSAQVCAATPSSYAYSGLFSVEQRAKGPRVGSLIVDMFVNEVCGPGLDRLCRSASATSSASRAWPFPPSRSSFPFNEVSGPASQRDADLIKGSSSNRFESSSSFHLVVQSAVAPTAIIRTVLSSFLDLVASKWDEAFQRTTYDSACGSDQAWLDAALSSRRKMHSSIFVSDQGNPQVLIMKDRSSSVMGVVQMDWLAGMLSIGRYDGGMLGWWMSAKVIPSLKPAAMEEVLRPAARKLTSPERLWPARRRRPECRSLALTGKGVAEVFQLQSQDFHGDRYPCFQKVRMQPAPALPSLPIYAVEKMIEGVTDSKLGNQEAIAMSSASSTAGMMHETCKQQLLETWWDEDAVLVGAESEEIDDDFEHICDCLEEWETIPTLADDAPSKSFLCACRSAVASSFSARTTR